MHTPRTRKLWAALVLLALAWSAAAQGTLQVANLRCAHRNSPMGIGDPAPLLSWQVQPVETSAP